MPLRYSDSRNRDLGPTAQRLLRAARRVVMRRGYAGLSIRAVGQEAGVHESLIHYHFGGKAGLVEALVNSLVQDPALALGEVSDAADGTPAEALMDAGRRTWANRKQFRLYNELLPHILRSTKLRQHVAAQYESIRHGHAGYLRRTTSLDVQSSERLAALGLALLDGLGLQSSLDPERFDQTAVYELWRDLVRLYVGAADERRGFGASVAGSGEDAGST
ncbi:MAG TPA: TetR/AcrR family transcriptional regulator [Thermoleophilia bacterium]|nr:TetR/AcrR family transcriptional regulator [Thermoleophilia bacterium]